MPSKRTEQRYAMRNPMPLPVTIQGATFTQSMEIEKAEYVHERRVVTATLLIKISNSCFAYINVYIGNNDRLYLDGFPEKPAMDAESLLQFATYFTLRERRIIEEIMAVVNGR